MGNCFALDLSAPISSTDEPTADPEDVCNSYDDKPTADELELKEILSHEESPAYQQFSSCATSNGNAGVLKCWSRIAAYRASAKDAYQEVCQISEECYISACSHESMLKFGAVKKSLQALQQKIDARARAGKPSRPTKKLRPIFDELEALCFNSIYEEVYPLYKAHCAEQIAAEESCGAQPVTENVSMHPDEFEHFAAAPDPAHPSALITCCQRKSNKKNYAMKAIPKSYLLWKHRRNLGNILRELRCYTGLDHPFISSLSFAFQTSVAVFLVQPLSFYVDLRQFALARFDQGRLPLKLVQFYTAEIVSALNYLHSNDYVFKELRPSNILVDGDGHIMLRNCSSIEDVKISSNKKSENRVSGAVVPGEEEPSRSFRGAKGAHDDWSEEASFDGMHVSNAKQQVSHPQSAASSTARKPGVGFGGTKVAAGWNSGNIDEPCDLNMTPPVGNGSSGAQDQSKHPGIRRTSDFVSAAAHSFGHGTSSPLSAESITFLAPELILQCFQTQSCHDPASVAVDWWALGCTIYTMLVGKGPFREVPLEELEYRLPNELIKNKYEDVFANLFGVANYHVVLSVDEEGNEEKMDPVAVLLMRSLLQFSPVERLSKNSPEPSEGRDSTGSNNSNKSSGNNSNNSSIPRPSSASLDDSGNISIRSASSIRHQKIAEHAFFSSIVWQTLEEKKIPPPLPFELDVAPTAVASISCSGTSLSPAGSGTFTPAEASSPFKGSAFGHALSFRYDSFSSVLELHGKQKWAEEDASCAQKLAATGSGKSACKSLAKAVRSGGSSVLPSITVDNDSIDAEDGCKSVASTRGVRIGAIASGQISDGSGEGEDSAEKKHNNNSGGPLSAQSLHQPSASLSPLCSQTTTHSKFFVSEEQQSLFQGWDFVNYRELKNERGGE